MKLLLALTLALTTTLSFAATISSMEDCNINFYYLNGAKNTYTLKDSRVSGQPASIRLSSVKKGGVSQVEKDVLGVERYETITKTSLLEVRGEEVNSCEGVYYANKVDVCTTDSKNTVCETFCKFEWRGKDCR